MAWRRLIKEVRPNMETPFFAASDEDILHIHEKYESSGKCSIVDISYSRDGLTKSKTRIFDSESSRDEYMADPVIQELSKSHQAHCLLYNTVKSKVEDKEI